ncbi:purine nucleoside permease [Rhodobacteraceae bacterium RKSG542]|uniref:purine-nucleoside phosphorylase n=1 Tax=Pseudovibrio flavus TaxID=2529854 RepID=UPI0012BBDB15|nr:purine nucleoside permease [Pseudovibrio flavus]MTI17514.1 purine nucleoside permease [Pseudovibrio flavus]
MNLRSLALCLATLALPVVAQAQPVAPKVMVITMFDGETKPWLTNLDLSNKIEVPGLPASNKDVACNDDLCVATTTMGFANAASTTLALTLSDKFDFSQTYFLIAGIAGIDPNNGTLSAATWADYVVDVGLFHRIDDREAPAEWNSQIIGLGTKGPGEKATWGAGNEVFKLNPALVKLAYETTKDVELADSDIAKAYRAAYSQDAAKGAPNVMVCSTASTDTYWHGKITAEEVAGHVATLTEGKGDYCTSQMEDNATLTALRRAADAGKLDFERIAVLRTASNFDRQNDNQTAIESLKANSGGFPPAKENAFRVGNKFAQEIIGNWDKYSKGLGE